MERGRGDRQVALQFSGAVKGSGATGVVIGCCAPAEGGRQHIGTSVHGFVLASPARAAPEANSGSAEHLPGRERN